MKDKMLVKVDLPDEYWHALTFIAKKMGYEARQPFVADCLKSVVEKHQDCLAKGRAEKILIQQRKDLAKDVVRVMEEVQVPIKRNYFNLQTLQWKVEFVDGNMDNRIVNGGSQQNDVFKIIFGRLPMNDQEFNSKIKKCTPL